MAVFGTRSKKPLQQDEEKKMPDYESMTEEEREEHMKALRSAMGEEEEETKAQTEEDKPEEDKPEEEARAEDEKAPSASQGSAPPPSATGEDRKPAALSELKAAFAGADGSLTQEAMAYCFVCAEQGLSVSQAKAMRGATAGQAKGDGIPEAVRFAAQTTKAVETAPGAPTSFDDAVKAEIAAGTNPADATLAAARKYPQLHKAVSTKKKN